MPYRRTAFLAGEFYHLYNRGVDRSPVFFSTENYLYFIRLLESKAARDRIRITAFCLMPNHFHLLVCPEIDHAVSRWLNALLGSYVQAVNMARGRAGPLFQGRTKSVRVARDEYLAHVARYIHLNPVAATLVVRPQDWPYSNYGRVIAAPPGIRSHDPLIGGVFPDGASYQGFVEALQPDLPASLKLAGR
jgi:REP element-mobilizing transposase RayT